MYITTVYLFAVVSIHLENSFGISQVRDSLLNYSLNHATNHAQSRYHQFWRSNLVKLKMEP